MFILMLLPLFISLSRQNDADFGHRFAKSWAWETNLQNLAKSICPLVQDPDCSLRQGARPHKSTYKDDNFTYFLIFKCISNIYVCYFVSKLCFFSFSTQNHAESSRNFVKNSIWDNFFLCNTFF